MSATIRLPKSALKSRKLAGLLESSRSTPKKMIRALTPKRVAKMLRKDNGIPVTFPIHFVIVGAPRTKKNHPRRLKRGDQVFVVPSEAYEQWNIEAVRQLEKQFGANPSIAVDVNCRALILRETLTGDACGFYESIADTLQDAGVVVNDKFVVSWDGSRLQKDRDNPRVILTLELAQ